MNTEHAAICGAPLNEATDPRTAFTVIAGECLAAEAGVKRHALTHKHTDLKDLFNARVKAQHSVPAAEAALRGQNDELRRKLDDMRAERDEYKQAADALARALNVLTAENDELRRRANRARQFTGPRPLAQLGPTPASGGTRMRLAWHLR